MDVERVSARKLQAMLGVNKITLKNLTDDGTVIRLERGQYDLISSVKNYCASLRSTAAGRGGKDAVESLSQERARLAKEQADGHELKNAALRGELVQVAKVEATWAGILRDVRSAMLAVASRVQQRVGTLTAGDVREIDEEIRDTLKALGDDRGST